MLSWLSSSPPPPPPPPPPMLSLSSSASSQFVCPHLQNPPFFDQNIEQYDPSTDTWESKNAMPTDRGAFGAAMAGSKLIVSGGTPQSSGPVKLAVAETYDSSTDIWATVNYMPTVRGGDGTDAAAVKSRAYIFGGWNPTLSYSNVLEAYEGSVVGRSMSRAATYQNLVYLVGAQPGSTAPAMDLQKYTPTMDTWLTLNNMPTARASHGWELVGSKVRCLLPFVHCSPTAMCPLMDCRFSPAAARFR